MDKSPTKQAKQQIELGTEKATAVRFYTKLNKVFAPKVTSVPKDARGYQNALNLTWDNKLAIHRVYQFLTS